ncbi:MAG: DnaJ domain-containing protein [Myxococcaceae bacterium]|nr:DnaJ domain-containing protein [Myxococcaceae bacterium]
MGAVAKGVPAAAPPKMAVAMGAVAPAVKPAPPSAELAATGPVSSVNVSQLATLAQLADALDSMDYFQILKVEQTAPPQDIKRAFYQESRTYHPDRFFHLGDAQVKDAVGAIYKRITEAYYFLRDDNKRRKYLADITGPDRANKLRFTETSEAEAKAQVKKEQEEQIGTTPKGRQFYATAMGEYGRENWSGAERNFKMALTFEPSNARYKERLNEVQQKLHDTFKKSGDSFKIR